MKKNYFILLLAPIITSLTLFPGSIYSQDLTDEQRKERCQNNKNRIAELETELKVVNEQLSSTMTQGEMRDASSHLAFVEVTKKDRAFHQDGVTIAKTELLRIAGRYNFNFDKCLTEVPYPVEIQCLSKLEKIIASKIDKAKTLNRPEILAKRNEIDKILTSHRNRLIELGCDQFSAVSGNTGSGCFASDPKMGSTNRDDHYNWAQGQYGSQLEANMNSKMNILYSCPSVSHDAFAAVFADISVIISQYAQEINSLNNDAGARNPDRSAHYNWAKNQSREQVLQNLQWKMKETFKNLDSREGKIFFADCSVPIAQANQTSSSNANNSGGNNDNGGITQAVGEWKVWVKTSPCSGRFDWISVARENPTASGNFFYLASQIFPGTNCASIGCTFQDATAVANTLRASPAFSKYCCRDYSVWEHKKTKQRTVIQGKLGTAGPGWEQVKPDLCYEEALALQKEQQQTGEWKVWVRTSPCSGRYDWVTVAKENPTGGQNFYYLANSLFPGTTCTTFGCTFEQATAAADALRPSDQFFKYCCRDYSVWEDVRTKERSILLGKQATGGFGWNPVPGGSNLCCEEAEALAGRPGGCSSRSRTQQNTKCWPGSYAAWDEQAKKMKCFCKEGLVWNSANTACVDPQELVKKADCSGFPGSFAVWNSQKQRVDCKCPEGKVWNSAGSACIDDLSKVNCYPGSHAVFNSQTNSTECVCNVGLVLNWSKTACVDPQELVRTADCSGFPGTHAVWNNETKKVECYCPEGKVWNSTEKACIDDLSKVKCIPGSHAVFNSQTKKVECACNTGLVLNSSGTACIEPTTKTGGDLNWNGTFVDDYNRATLSGGGNAVSCSWTYTVSDAKGTGTWSNCKVVGNTVTGNWTAQHEDDTKTGTRKGTFTATLSGNTLSGQLLEDTPQWNYKPGYNSSNVQSSMAKGKIWTFTWKRQ